MKQLLLFAIALLLAYSLYGADLSGTWSGQMPTRDGGTRDVAFKFKQSGSALSGTMSAFDNDIPIKDGKVQGDALSFSVTLELGGNDVKLLFTGKVKGDQLDMTREREGTATKQNFTLKRGS
jgi:hypothetical protein